MLNKKLKSLKFDLSLIQNKLYKERNEIKKESFYKECKDISQAFCKFKENNKLFFKFVRFLKNPTAQIIYMTVLSVFFIFTALTQSLFAYPLFGLIFFIFIFDKSKKIQKKTINFLSKIFTLNKVEKKYFHEFLKSNNESELFFYILKKTKNKNIFIHQNDIIKLLSKNSEDSNFIVFYNILLQKINSLYLSSHISNKDYQNIVKFFVKGLSIKNNHYLNTIFRNVEKNVKVVKDNDEYVDYFYKNIDGLNKDKTLKDDIIF